MASVASPAPLTAIVEVSSQSVEGMMSELIWFLCGFALIRLILAFGVGPRMRLSFDWSSSPRLSILRSRSAPEARGSVRRCAVKSMVANANAGKYAAVVEAWQHEKSRAAALPIDGLQAVAQALANEKPESAVDELTLYITQHATVHAKSATVNALLETLAFHSGNMDMVQDFATAAKKQMSVAPDKATHEILVGAYAAAGNQGKVDELNKAMGVAHVKMTQRGHSLVVKGFVKSGNLQGALRQVLQMVDQDLDVPPQAVSEVFRAACAQGRASLQMALDQLEGHVELSEQSVALIFNHCSQTDDFDMAFRVQKMAGTNFGYAAYEPLLKLYAKLGCSRGVELFQSMLQDGFFASEGLCGSLMAKCAESQNLRFAESIVAYLRERSMMTLATYKTLMKVYACCGLFDQACDLYQQVRDDGIEPDHVMYGCLVKFAVKCNRTELSQELFERANGGDVQNYMWLIRAAGAKGDVKKAFELLRKLENSSEVNVDIVVYNSVLDVCVSNNEVAQAHDLLKDIKAKGLINLVTYNTLMKGHCAKGDVQRARRIMREMVEDGFVPDAASYNCILGAAVTAGNFNVVWDILAEMDKMGVSRDHYTVSIMMKVARKAKNPKDAQWALSALDQEGLNVCEDDVLLNTVLDACVHRRDLQRLEKVLRSFESSGMKPSVHTYGLLIKAFSVQEKTWRCRELWTEMVEQRHIVPNNMTFSCMLDAIISAGEVEEAVALFEQWKVTVPPNTVIYSTLIKGFASQGDAERAMQMYKRVRTEGLQMNLVAYTTLIDAQARVGNMAEATELLKQMREDGCQPNVITYSTLVKGYCMQGNLEEAFHAFNDMLENGLAADTVIFNTLLDGCVRHSRFELADELLADMGKYGVEASNFTVSIMIKMWGKRRRLEDAFQTVRSALQDKRLRLDSQVGTCLVSACIHNRNVDRALDAFEEIKTWRGCDGPDASTYNALITGLVRFGRCHKAVELMEEAHRLVTASKRSMQRVSPETVKLLFKSLRQYNLAEELGKPLAEKLGDPKAWERTTDYDYKDQPSNHWRRETNNRAAKQGMPRRMQ